MNKKVIFLLLAIALLTIMGIILLFLRPKTATPPMSQGSVFPTPYPLSPQTTLPVFSLQRTKVGRTTEGEIQRLSITAQTMLPDGSQKYTLSSPNPYLADEIIAKGGAVIFEKMIYPTSTTQSERTRLTTLLEKYGESERVIKGSADHGPQANIYSYSSKGFVIIGNPNINYVLEVQVFYPMSTESYLKYYGKPFTEKQHEGI